MADLTVTVEESHPQVVTVTCVGEIDIITSPRFGAVVRECISTGAFDTGRRLVVDLNQVRYIDSTGIGQLIGVLQQLHERDAQANLWLIMDGCPLVKKIFRQAKITTLFMIVTANEFKLSLQQSPDGA